MKARTEIFIVSSFSLLLLVGLAGLVSAQGGDMESGKALFGEYCAGCHGYDGQGRAGATLTGWFASIDPQAFVRATVSDGVGEMMPAFSEAKGGPLSEQEVDDIAAYILSWRERVEPAPTPTPIPVTPIPKVAGVSGDPTAGAQVYAVECEKCHGEEGQGGVGASLSSVIAAAQPAAFIRQVVNDGVAGSPMPAFRDALSEDDVENVVAFVLSWDREPAPVATPSPEEETGFNWLVGVLLVIGALVVIGVLTTRFSQRKALDE